MFLTECYVENFGVLHQFYLKPAEGLNCIYEKNGFGKSTFAAFISAMFYGMVPTRNRKNLDDAERKKYKPWQQGMWGGYICFEYENGRYKIERTFGLRDKEDTFKLTNTDTGLESDRFGKDVGYAIFGVDRQTFLSTFYMRQSNLFIDADSIDISLKNTRIPEDDQDEDDSADDICVNDIQNATKKLENIYREYVKTGGRGAIAQIKDRINELDKELQENEFACDKLKQEQNMCASDNLKEKQNMCACEQRKIKQGTNACADFPDETSLTKVQQERLSWLDDYFSAGIPDETALKNEKTDLKKKKEAKGYIVSSQRTAGRKLLMVGMFLLLAAMIAAAVSFAARQVLIAVVAAVFGGVSVLLAVIFAGKCSKQEGSAAAEVEKINKRLDRIAEIERYIVEYNYLSDRERIGFNAQQELDRRAERIKQNALDKQIKQLSEKIFTLRMQKDAYTAELNECEHKAKITGKTLEYMKKAGEKYTSENIADISLSFKKYLALFDERLAENAVMNVKYDVGVKDSGIVHELAYYSGGVKDIIRICERMAFADSIMQGRQTFLIMDDPFVNLDDDMYEKAVAMLEKVAGKYQIFYMTCSKYRCIDS